MKNLDSSDPEFKKIDSIISSEESVVGIDAKKTHIIIIPMLNQIKAQLDNIETRLDELEKS